MTEDQTTDEQVDNQRQAELDSLAAQLASAAAGETDVKAPRKRASRRVTAANPAEYADAVLPTGAPEPEAEPAESGADEDAPSDVAPDGDVADDAVSDETQAADAEAAGDADPEADGADGEPRTGRSRRGRSRSRNGGGETAQGGQGAQGGNQQNGQSTANRRGRGRGPVGDDVEPEILEDDVLIPVAGILDVLDNYAFVRTTGYLPGPTDVYVSLGQVKKYGLRKGDAVVGAIRQPRDGEQPGRQKYNALVRIDSVNGQTAEQSLARPEFAASTAVRPTVGLGLHGAVSALGKGARALVVGEHGKTAQVAEIAEQISSNHPESHLMVILVAPRPEEITDFRRSVKGEVVIAGLEQTSEDHVTVIDLAVERAKRLVELGIDVVVLLDSITGLGRAHYALASRQSVEDPSIALAPRRLLASARAVEDGASLTIIATASESTAIDRLVASELRSTANALVQLA